MDNKFNVPSVIDRQGACIVLWELVEFPLSLNNVPQAMDATFNHDQRGQAKHSNVKLI